jgi:hypothetical protein
MYCFKTYSTFCIGIIGLLVRVLVYDRERSKVLVESGAENQFEMGIYGQ